MKSFWAIGGGLISILVVVGAFVWYFNYNSSLLPYGHVVNTSGKDLTQAEALTLVQNLPLVKAWTVTVQSSHVNKPIFDVVDDPEHNQYYVRLSVEDEAGQKTTYDLYFVDKKTGEISKNAKDVE